MKQIHIYLIFVALLCVNICFAQEYSVKSKKAIKLYEEARMTNNEDDRIALLERAIATKKQFVEAYWDLATIYSYKNNANQAIQILELIDNEDFAYLAETKNRMVNIYYRNGNYNLAIEKLSEIDLDIYTSYATKVMQMREKCKTAIDLMSHPIEFHPRNLDRVNTIYDDYFPSITADGKMISTTVLVPIPTYGSNNYSPEFLNTGNNLRYQEDLYYSKILDNGTWNFSEPLPPPMSGFGNQGSQSFSADGRYMFFVRCDGSEGYGSCDIFYSIRIGNKWSNSINLGAPANTEYWESNPVMSPTGDMIYFSSSRPGGVGRRDIWTVEVEILKDGTLRTSNAQPLDKTINTLHDDFAPFIHADNKTLYFSSGGHDGLGGFDIFMSKKGADGNWSKPINIGYPINTHGDESGFVVNGLGDKAYFASNQIENNNKGLEIYEIDLPSELRPKTMLYSPGVVFDAVTKKPLQAKVEIFNQTSNEKYFESITDKKYGDFTVMLPDGDIYGMSVQLDNYLFYTASINNPGDSIIIPLQPIIKGSVSRLNNLFFDTDSDEILESSTAEITRLFEFFRKNSNISVEIVGHTDNQGSEAYNENLSARRANALMNALLEKGVPAHRMTAVGKGSKSPVASNDTEEGRAQNRRVEIVIK